MEVCIKALNLQGPWPFHPYIPKPFKSACSILPQPLNPYTLGVWGPGCTGQLVAVCLPEHPGNLDAPINLKALKPKATLGPQSPGNSTAQGTLRIVRITRLVKIARIARGPATGVFEAVLSYMDSSLN